MLVTAVLNRPGGGVELHTSNKARYPSCITDVQYSLLSSCFVSALILKTTRLKQCSFCNEYQDSTKRQNPQPAAGRFSGKKGLPHNASTFICVHSFQKFSF